VAATAPLAFWFFRHAEISSHRGDLPATSAGLVRAEEVGRALAGSCPEGARVAFLHAPTIRTVQTAEALRRGLRDALPASCGVDLREPAVERAIRNPDVYVAGHRVEMVSSFDAVAEQLPAGAMTRDELERHEFFSRFIASPDRIGMWVADDDPAGERADEVAWRFWTWARSVRDTERPYPRRFVCVTHSGPLRAIVRRYVLGDDPGEPEYVEAVELAFDEDGSATWRFRKAVVPMTVASRARHGGPEIG
jgi:broad specificity phosphatase PhoE